MSESGGSNRSDGSESHPYRRVGRGALPHQPPLSIDMAKEIFFITISCAARGKNQLCHRQIANVLFEAARFYESRDEWHIHLMLLMPDHVHFLASFAADAKLGDTVARWKRYTSRHAGVQWQRDFFDHRLRREQSYREKADYILRNPIRAGLVISEDDWPFRIVTEQVAR